MTKEIPYKEWIKLPPEKAAEYVAEKLDLDKERMEKLKRVLKSKKLGSFNSEDDKN